MGLLARWVSAAAPSPAPAMAAAASKFLLALATEQKSEATFPLEDAHRTTWFYTPVARKGVPLKKLTPEQRRLAHALLKTGLSAAGYLKTTQIIQLETVLAEIEKNPTRRDAELYYFSVFGTPSAAGTWGWRMEGHHVSLNFTVIKGRLFSTTPHFFGANPAEVRIGGPHKGWRVLRAEEDLGRQLAIALHKSHADKVLLPGDAPPEILTKNQPKVDALPPAGVRVLDMSPPQVAMLRKLLDEYASSMPPPLAKQRMARIEEAGLENVAFVWGGARERGQPHYYRVSGPTFLIEYDNTQNDANHIHVVWRDFEGDFGRDLLREHYQRAHE